MNRADLVTHIAGITDLPNVATSKAVDAVFYAIGAALGRGEDVEVRGFGSFAVVDRPARTGRNPKTGEPIEIPASGAAKFKAGKVLKWAIQG